jgi:hypothetical protein
MKCKDMEGEHKFLSAIPKGCNLEGGIGVFLEFKFLHQTWVVPLFGAVSKDSI